MINGIRIFLVCFILVGGTVFFALWSLNRFNQSLDTLHDTYFAIANQPPVLYCDKTNEEQISTTNPEELAPSAEGETASDEESTTEQPSAEGGSASGGEPDTSTEEISPDLNVSFIFPKKDAEVYRGCTYQISFQSSAAIGSLVTDLVDAGARETIDPAESGLAEENEIEPNSQSFDWKVGSAWPGEYYIKVSDINGVDLRSDVFKVRIMSNDLSADEREEICKG